MSDTLCALEIGAVSSLALTRVEKLTGYRFVEVTVVEGYAPLTVAGKVIDGEQSTASVYLESVEQVDRLMAALTEARAFLAARGERYVEELPWPDNLIAAAMAAKEQDR